MFNLFKIELRKAYSNKAFWILLGLYTLLTVIVFFSIQGVIDLAFDKAGANSPFPIPKESIYTFPKVYQNLAYIAGFYKIFLAILIIIFVTNEYSYRTIRQNVVNGMSREGVLIGKLLLIFVISLFSMILIFLCSIILGFINTDGVTSSMFFEKMFFIPTYFLEVFFYLCFAMMIAHIVKRSGLAIGIFFLYSYIVEYILYYKLPDSINDYLPLRAIGGLVKIPNTQLMQIFGINFQEYVGLPELISSFVWAIIFVSISYLLIKKRDL
ncbi:MAG: ABC transporter permease [Hyphomicrobiales bacterium]